MKRYHVGDLVGSGGMGAVYRAYDRLLRQEVALKRLDLATNAAPDPALIEPLVREFSLLASLRHPNIITVLDYGVDEQRQPFFTMELLEGGQTAVEAARAAAWAERIDLALQLMQACAYLHRHGLLHRDLKPGNVLVAAGRLRLLDFGLALDVAGGTADYMPPETLQHGDYTPASDLYSAGVLLVEMLAGHRPFAAGDALAIFAQPPDLSGIEPPELRAVLARLLDPDPARRYPSADAALAALMAGAGVKDAESLPVRESYLRAAPFVGREREYAHLKTALDRVLAGEGGAALLVGGESGAGKSRLLNELRIHALISGALVMGGQATESGSLPYQLWRDPIVQLAVYADLTDFEAAVLAEAQPEIAHLLDRPLPSLPAMNGEEALKRLAQTFIDVIRRSPRPVLLIVEDIHWADDSTPLLETVVRLAPDLPLLVVGSYRREAAGDLPQRLPGMTPLLLEPLSPDEIGRLTNAMIGAAGERSALVERLQRESDGNVLFLIETIRYLAEQAGGLSHIHDAPLPAAIFPESVVQIIQRRLERVPAWAQTWLKLAAVAGRGVELELMAAVGGAAFDADRWLYVCANAAVLEVRENRWRFAHDKLREALLILMPPDERVALHRQLALALEALYGDDPAHAKPLVEQWAGAGEIERALHYTLIAGAHLARLGSMLELRAIAARGLGLLRPTDSPDIRLRLLLLLAAACKSNDLECAKAAYGEAAALSEALNRQDEQITARLGLADVYTDQNDYEQAEQLLTGVIAAAQQHNHLVWLEEAYRLKSTVTYYQGQYKQAQSEQEYSLALAQQFEDPYLIALNLSGLGIIHLSQGHVAAATPYLEQALELAQEIGAHRITANMWTTLGTVAAHAGDRALSIARYEMAIPILEALGEYGQLASTLYNRGIESCRLFQYDEALQWFLREKALLEDSSDHRQMMYCLFGLSTVEFGRRNYEAAHHYALESLDRALKANHVRGIVFNQNQIVSILLRLGRRREAQTALAHGLATALQSNTKLYMLDMLHAAIEYALYEDRFEEAAAWLSLVRSHPEGTPGDADFLNEFQPRLEAQLDPDALAAATEQGKTLDLQETVSALLRELAAV